MKALEFLKQERAHHLAVHNDKSIIQKYDEAIKELDYQYMETGRRIDFLPKEDFQGSIYLKEEEEVTKEFKVPNKKDENGNAVTVRGTIERHIQLKSKSKAPKNKKKK